MPDPIVPAPQLSGHATPVIPVLGRRGDYMPTLGGWLTVSLPGEDVRATVVEIASRDVVIVELTGTIGVVRGGHQYRRNDIVAVQRGVSDGGLKEIWSPLSEREVRMREEAERLAAAAVAQAAAPEKPRRSRAKKDAP